MLKGQGYDIWEVPAGHVHVSPLMDPASLLIRDPLPYRVQSAHQ